MRMMLLNILVNVVVLGILIAVHEMGHFFAAKKAGVRVEKFFLGFGPRIYSRKKGDTEYGVAAIPLGGYVKMAGDSMEEASGKADEYYSKPPLARAMIIAAGPVLNYVLGFLFFWLVFFIGLPVATTKVGTTLDGYGAKDAGILKGDIIRAIDGKKVPLWDDLQKAVQEHKGAGKVQVQVERAGATLDIPVALVSREYQDPSGKKKSVGILGVTPSEEMVIQRFGILQSCAKGFERTMDFTVLTYEALWRMLTGRQSVKESVTGPLGVFYMTSKVASLGVVYLLHWLALLSISLGLFNLLPIPVFDGGHLFFLALEKLRGRRLGQKTERVITNIGLSFIVCFVLFVTYNDVIRLFGSKLASLVK